MAEPTDTATLADLTSQFTLEDVIAHGDQAGKSPEEIAGAVRKWRDAARAYGETKLREADPQKWFRGNDKLDSRIAEEMSGLQARAVAERLPRALPDEPERKAFIDAFNAAGGDPDKMALGVPENFRAVARQLQSEVFQSDTFRPPAANGTIRPLATKSGVVLGDFETQKRPGNDGFDINIRLDLGGGQQSGRKAITIPEISLDEVKLQEQMAREDVAAQAAIKTRAEADLAAMADDPVEADGMGPGLRAEIAKTLKAAEIRMAESQKRAELFADPEKGRATLINERVKQAVQADPVLSRAIGQTDLGEDFWRGVQQTHLGTRMAIADASGNVAEKEKIRGLLAELPQIYPGSTNAQFNEGAGEFVSDLSAVMGGMAPTLIVAAASGGLGPVGAVGSRFVAGATTRAAAMAPMSLSAYGNSYASMLNEADALEAQGDVGGAAQRRRDARIKALADAAVETGTEFIFKEEMLQGTQPGVLRKIGAGAAQNALEESLASIGQGESDFVFRDQIQEPGDVVRDAALGAAMGGVMGAGSAAVEAIVKEIVGSSESTLRRDKAEELRENGLPNLADELDADTAAMEERVLNETIAATPIRPQTQVTRDNDARLDEIERLLADPATNEDEAARLFDERQTILNTRAETRDTGVQIGTTIGEDAAVSVPTVESLTALPVGDNYTDPTGTVWTRRDDRFGKPILVTTHEGGAQVRWPVQDVVERINRLQPPAQISSDEGQVAETPANVATVGTEVNTPGDQSPNVQRRSQSPATGLRPKSNVPVPPRPTERAPGESRAQFVERGDAWDEGFGDMRKGGRTHNDDGTPYQPTLLDETVPTVFAAVKDMSVVESIDAIGVDNGAELSTAVGQLLDAGWEWDASANRMVDPKNPSAKPVDALRQIRSGAAPSNQSSTPGVAEQTVEGATAAPEVEATQAPGPLFTREVTRTQQLAPNLVLNVERQEDGLWKVRKVNTETGRELPLPDDAPSGFANQNEALAYVESVSAPVAEPESRLDDSPRKPARDEFMDLVRVEGIPAPFRSIKNNAAITQREGKGFRAKEKDQNKLAETKQAPRLDEFEGNREAQDMLRSIYRPEGQGVAPDVLAQTAYENGWIPAPTSEALFEGIRQRLRSGAQQPTAFSNEDAEAIAMEQATREQGAADAFFGNLRSIYRSGGVINASALQEGDVLTVGDDTVTVEEITETGPVVSSRKYGRFQLSVDDRVGYDRFEQEAGIPVAERDDSLPNEIVDRSETDTLTSRLRESIRERTGRDYDVRVVTSAEHNIKTGDRRALDAARRLAAMFGFRIVGVDGAPFNGAIRRLEGGTDNNIYLNVNSTRPELNIAAHELLHQMRTTAPELYAKMLTAFRADIDAYLREVRPENRGLNQDTIIEEFLADYLGERALDPAFWESLAERDPSLFQELADFILKFLRGIMDRIRQDTVKVERYLVDQAKMRDAIEEALIEFRYQQSLRDRGMIDESPEVFVDDDAMPFADFVDPETDAKYLELAKDPEANREELQRMVDESARAAMPESRARKSAAPERWMDYEHDPKQPLLDLYHGGEKGITSFSRTDSRGSAYGSGTLNSQGVWLTQSRGREGEVSETFSSSDAATYAATKPGGGQIYHVFADIRNPKRMAQEDARRVTVQELRDQGFDGVEFIDSGFLVALNPNQIKSADPVTYDESGNVIPLSQRFDTRKGSILFADGPTNRLTDAQYNRHAELEAKHDAGTITDEETKEAQRLVDEAAKAGGYNAGPLFHFGPEWTRADKSKFRQSIGVHLGTKRQADSMGAIRDGKEMKRLFAPIQNPIRLSDKGIWGFDQVAPQLEVAGVVIPQEIKEQREGFRESWGGDKDGFVRWSNDTLARLIQENGYDSVVYLNESEGVDLDGMSKDSRLPPPAIRKRSDWTPEIAKDYGAEDSFIVFDANQIKSAEPFTGVPLRERFNPASDDIRFADYQPKEKVQQDFSKPGRRDFVLSFKNEVTPVVRERAFDSTQPITAKSQEDAAMWVSMIQDGLVDVKSETGLDGSNQILIVELKKFADRVLIETGDDWLVRQMAETNDFFEREATVSSRNMRARQEYDNPEMNKVHVARKDSRDAVIQSVAPSVGWKKVDLVSELADLQKELDAAKRDIEELRKRDPESFAALDSLEAKAPKKKGGRRVGPEEAKALADWEAQIEILASGGEILFADLEGEAFDKAAALRRYLRIAGSHSAAKRAGMTRDVFIKLMAEVDVDRTRAEYMWKFAVANRPIIQAAQRKDAATLREERRAAETVQEQAQNARMEEAVKADRLNRKLTKIADRLEQGPKKREAKGEKDPVLARIEEGIKQGDKFDREAFIRRWISDGVDQEIAERMANTVQAQQRINRDKGLKQTPAEELKRIVARYVTPVQRSKREKSPMMQLVRSVVKADSTVTEAEFAAEATNAGLSQPEAKSLWSDLKGFKEARQKSREEARKAREKDAPQKEAEALVKKLEGKETAKPKSAKSDIRKVYNDAIGLKTPMPSRASFVETAELAGVKTETAERLFELALAKRIETQEKRTAKRVEREITAMGFPFTEKGKAAAEKRKNAPDRPSLSDEILSNPKLSFAGPEERRKIIEGIIRDRTGLSEDQVKAETEKFAAKLEEIWDNVAKDVAAKYAKDRNAPGFRKPKGSAKKGKEKSVFDDIEKALRSGAYDPAKRGILDDVAKANGWRDLTTAELQEATRLAAELRKEGITEFEENKIKGQIVKIIRNSDAPPSVQDIVTEGFTAGIFSGPNTWGIQTSAVFTHVFNVFGRDMTAALMNSWRRKKADDFNLDGWRTAVRRSFGQHMQNAAADAAVAFTTGQMRGVKDPEILNAWSKLEYVFDRAVPVLKDKNASRWEKTKAALLAFYSSQFVALRILASLDSFTQGMIRSYVHDLEVFSKAAGLGMSRAEMNLRINAALSFAKDAQDKADDMGLTGAEKYAFVNDTVEMRLQDAFTGEMKEDRQGNQFSRQAVPRQFVAESKARSYRESALETGVNEFQTGSNVIMRAIIRGLRQIQKEGKLGGRLLIPVLRTVFNIMDRSMWFMPGYSDYRMMMVKKRTDGYKSWFDAAGNPLSGYETALADPVQLARRQRERAAGWILTGGAAALIFANAGLDDEDKWFIINLGGPKLKDPRFKAWRDAGRRPFTVQVGPKGARLTIGFRRGGFEVLNAPLTLLGAYGQSKYDNEKQARTNPILATLNTLGKEFIGEAVFPLREYTSRSQAIDFENTPRNLGFYVSRMVPYSAFLKFPVRNRDMQEHDDAARAFLSEIPLVQLAVPNDPKLNALGDPVGTKEDQWLYMLSKVNIPFGLTSGVSELKPGEEPRQEHVYKLMAEKGYFPSVKDHSKFDKSVTEEKYQEFVKRRGDAIEKFIKMRYRTLSAMDDDKFQKAVSSYGEKMTEQLQRQMRLKNAKAE